MPRRTLLPARPLLAHLPRRSAHVGSCRHRGTRRQAALVAVPAGADLNAPCSGRKLALGSPNLSCLSPVCWLFRLRRVEPPRMQDACLRVTAAIVRDPRPPEGLLSRTRALAVLATISYLFCQPSAQPVLPNCYPPSTVVPSRPSPLRPFTTHSALAPDPETCCLTFAFTSAAVPGRTAATSLFNRPSLRHLPATRHH